MPQRSMLGFRPAPKTKYSARPDTYLIMLPRIQRSYHERVEEFEETVVVKTKILEVECPELVEPATGSTIRLDQVLCTPRFMDSIKHPLVFYDALHILFTYLEKLSSGDENAELFYRERHSITERNCTSRKILGIFALRVQYMCRIMNKFDGLGWSDALLLDVLEFLEVLIPAFWRVDLSTEKLFTRRTMGAFEYLLCHGESPSEVTDRLLVLFLTFPMKYRQLLTQDSIDRLAYRPPPSK